jgi:hypothetical protein
MSIHVSENLYVQARIYGWCELSLDVPEVTCTCLMINMCDESCAAHMCALIDADERSDWMTDSKHRCVGIFIFAYLVHTHVGIY